MTGRIQPFPLYLQVDLAGAGFAAILSA